MAVSDITSTWESIRRGVKDAEMLIAEKKYNMSMIKSRQVLELMINYLCDNASISESDLASSIDVLYDEEWINKTTCEHYHKIRMLGNKAVHEGNDNGYDANQAYHLLSQEVYTFANDYKSKRGRTSGGNSATRSGGNRSSSGRSSAPRDTARRSSGSRSSTSRSSSSRSSGRGSSSRTAKSRRRQPTSGFSVSPTDLVRLGLILVVVVVIILAVRLLKPKDGEQESETSSTPVPTSMFPETMTSPETLPPVETMAETTPAPVYKTSDTLNVRSEPSTAGTRLGLLEPGTIVDYVEDYDDEWTIINYNGTEAYVSSQYLVHD